MECRTCLNITDDLQDLFTEDCDLPHKIETISSIQILVNDQFPSKICHSCVTNVEFLYDFRGIVRRSNMILESRVCSAQKQETNESGKNELTDTELIQIDEIKMESEIESLDFEDPVESKEEITNEEVLTCRGTIRKSNRGKKTIANKVYNCTECDFNTEHYNSLRTHRKRHKDRQELRSICNICGKSITTDNLSKHLSNHTDTPVTCKICGKVVKHKESLRGHMYMHKGITLQCTFCGKIFHNRQSYYKHLQRHKNGGAKTVKCPMCEKLFHEKKSLTKHIRSHTGERPYPCEYCKKGFSSPYALKTHVRQHTNEKPFACDFCDMAFPQRVSLRTHLKSKHPDKTLDPSS